MHADEWRSKEIELKGCDVGVFDGSVVRRSLYFSFSLLFFIGAAAAGTFQALTDEALPVLPLHLLHGLGPKKKVRRRKLWPEVINRNLAKDQSGTGQRTAWWQ